MEELGGAVFPFGSPSTPRPPRRPVGDAAVFVLGVYPSALHVRWTLPAWWSGERQVVGALAVADEPTVFWDGADAHERVADWKASIESLTATLWAGGGVSEQLATAPPADPCGTGFSFRWVSTWSTPGSPMPSIASS